MLNSKEDESLPPPTLLQRIEQNDSSLKELAGFGGFSCHKVAASLRKNHTITSFKLSHCNLGDDNDDGCKHVMQALIDRRSNLKRISLARNSIGLNGALAIANFILASRQTEDSIILYDSIRLDLLQNFVGDEGARVIADAIANNKTKGIDSIQTIVNIGFEKNRIGDEGLSYISNMLCGNTKLHTLRLGKNMITHEGVVKYLAPALAKNTSLRTLDLSSNRDIGDVGAVALAEILTSNNTLETLILTKCSITEAGAVRLLRALYNHKSPYSVLEESNHTLREIMLCQNPVMSTSLSGLSTTFLRDALQWNQKGIASARMFKLQCFLTSNDGPRYVHSIDLMGELIPNFVFKIWRISCLGVLYAYLKEMPELLEGCVL